MDLKQAVKLARSYCRDNCNVDGHNAYWLIPPALRVQAIGIAIRCEPAEKPAPLPVRLAWYKVEKIMNTGGDHDPV